MARYELRCVVIRDGDTFVGHYRQISYVPGWRNTLETYPSIAIRLLGVSCPEKREPGGPEASAYAAAWFQEHLHQHPAEHHGLWLDEAGYDNFGRILGIVTCQLEDGCLNRDLLSVGHAVPYRAGVAAARHHEALRTMAGSGPAIIPARILLREINREP
jgi:endonuclease YncB( thermonuclease family)